MSLAQVSDYTPLINNARIQKIQQTEGLNQAKYIRKMHEKPLHKTVLFAPIRDNFIRAGTVLASQRKDASSGKGEISAFDRIKPTSNSQ